MANNIFTLARVQEIVMDEFSKKYTGENSIGTISYTLLDEPTPMDIDDCLTAYPLYYNISVYPVPNEIVLLIPSPASNYNSSEKLKKYYLPPIGIQGMPSSNALPNALNPEREFYQGRYFTENEELKPLRPYEGDITVEGRFGNSIRFGSTINNKLTSHPNGWSQAGYGSIGDPITIISNGKNSRNADLNPGDHIIEDVNKDDSSIYLCTNHRLVRFKPSSLHDESYMHDIFQMSNTTEPDMIDGELELPEDVTEDVTLNTPNNIPPQELQQINELSDLQNTDVAYYDVSPTENQAISPTDDLTLPDNYDIPDTVDVNFLNDPI